MAPLTDDQFADLKRVLKAELHPGTDTGRWKGRLEVVLVIFAIASIPFSAGVSWSRVSAVEADLATAKLRITQLEQDQRAAERVSFDQKSDTRLINEKLDVLQMDLSDIKARMGLTRGRVPVFAHGQQFDK